MDTEFEWDPDKAESNLQKHGVFLRKRQLFSSTSFQSPFLILCILLRKIVSSSPACPISNVIWSWYIRIVVIEYESLARP